MLIRMLFRNDYFLKFKDEPLATCRRQLHNIDNTNKKDFLWEYNDEPHATRRRQILGNIL